MRTRVVGTVVAAALGVALAACGDRGPAASPDLGSSSSSTTAAKVVTTTTTAASSDGTIPIDVASVGDTLPDGKVFGYITALQVNDTTVTGEFDLAELLTGAAAVAAAQADGQVADDDYYIRNTSKKERAITVDPDAEVLDIDYQKSCCDPFVTNIAAFVADRDDTHEARTPVYLTSEHGIVTRVQEIYFP